MNVENYRLMLKFESSQIRREIPESVIMMIPNGYIFGKVSERRQDLRSSEV